MENTVEKLTSEEVTSWFDDLENFKHLPQNIQEKIVRFFVDQPVISVDACQIIEFLEFGNNFTVYYDYDEFISSIDFDNTKAILACKANFESADGVSDGWTHFSQSQLSPYRQVRKELKNFDASMVMV